MGRIIVWVIVILVALILILRYKPTVLKYPDCFIKSQGFKSICKSTEVCPDYLQDLIYKSCLQKWDEKRFNLPKL